MRVISGTARGLKLVTQDGTDVTRPTADRVKEAVFGSLQFSLRGSSVLDMFAGSGALGIEALSRGAKRAVFIDTDAKAIDAVKRNIAAAHFEECSAVYKTGFEMALLHMDERFDFVFIDPPYRSGLYQSAVDMLIKSGAIGKESLLLIEHDGTFSDDRLSELKRKKYGKTYVSFCKWESGN